MGERVRLCTCILWVDDVVRTGTEAAEAGRTAGSEVGIIVSTGTAAGATPFVCVMRAARFFIPHAPEQVTECGAGA